MKSKYYLLLILLTMSIATLAAMCGDDDDDNDNNASDDDNNDTNNNNDDDNNDNDTGGDDDDNDLVDYWEKTDCQGYDYPECGTDVDVPPELISVTIRVNGTEVMQPITAQATDEMTFAIEYEFPNDQLCGGHIFIVKNEEPLCLDKTDGTISDEPFPIGLPSICSTEAYGQPITFPVDPSIFLNGEGAPYYLEISNACATHSNRLPLEIVTVEE
jgi:hypothetical protein